MINKSDMDACHRAASTVTGLEDFKNWTRTHLRRILPHGALACVHGRIYGVGISLDYVITVDYPVEHLEAIRNASGHMDTPLASRWYRQHSPVFFDPDAVPDDTPKAWLGHFRRHRLGKTAADGVIDRDACVATYFSFHRLPTLDTQRLEDTFAELTPLLHDTFARVVRHLEGMPPPIRYNFNLLSEREFEIAKWVGNGKNNGEIAALLGVSEKTVKNHITRIFDKTGCRNRAGLAAAMAAQAQQSFGIGTKVL